MCGFGYWAGLPSWGLPLMGIVQFVFFCALAYGIYRLLRRAPCSAPVSDGGAVSILNRRYANGEITEEEYRRIKSEVQ